MKIKSFFLLLLGFNFLNAQLTLNVGKNAYYKTLIELEDGTVREGFVLSFDDKSAFYYDTSEIKLLFGSPENNMNLAREYYTFKKDKDSKDEKISIAQIKRITVDEPEFYSNEVKSVTYEKVKITKPNNDLKMDFKENPVLLPVYFSNSKLSIYNFTELVCSGKSASSCNVKGYNYYFLPKGTEYAVKPFEITLGSIFSLKKIGPKIYTALEYMGKNCPLYLSHLAERKSKYDESFVSIANKEFTNSFKVKQEEYKQDLKKAKKSMSKEDFKKYEIDKKSQQNNEQNDMFYNGIFNEEVIDYINSCE
ncbi:hypothetical protein [Moheibacter sediminis]|uniref:GLPGLI family protein n=1 Tax=Moheibacter sediminis TaxID=1434700 RepID=A0A1W2CGH1_9FLAO|nr:hypothetical protein [Moheibacter sediminis]SMC84280.1 hypothetical protein SAMN06296427_11054 [Moheibacter sediminis]